MTHLRFSRVSFALALGLVAAAATVATAVAMANPGAPTDGYLPYDSDPARQITVSPNEAAQHVRGMVQTGQRAVTGLQSAMRDRTLATLSSTSRRTAHLTATIRSTARRLPPSLMSVMVTLRRSCFRVSRPPPTHPPRSPPDQALAIASQYLADRAIPTRGLDPSVQLVDRGALTTYQVTWQRSIRGIEVPEVRIVPIYAATGTVYAVIWTTRAFQDPPAPKISKTEALDASSDAVMALLPGKMNSQAAKLAALAGNARLSVRFAPNGTQLLVWTVQFSVGESHFLVDVDASTGVASVNGQG